MAERPEACPEWREDLAAWAVAQGRPEREAALLAHLEGCPVCRAEADRLLAVAAVLALDVEPAPAGSSAAWGAAPIVPDGPSPQLGDRISRRIAAERRAVRRGQLLRRVAVAVSGAAAAAAVVAGAVVLTSDDDPERLEGEEFAFALVPDGGEAEAIVAPYEDGSSEVQLIASGLDPRTTYALWLAVPGGGRDERVPAGTFRPDGDGDVDVRFPCAMPADEVGRVWATSPERDLVLDTDPA